MTSPIRDDRGMSAALRSWLTRGDEPTPDRSRQIGRIMGRVDEVHQRRRLWPLNPFGQKAKPSEAVGTEGVVVTAHGRTAALVPVRALTVVALVVLVTASLMWVSSRPIEQPLTPAIWSTDPADQAMFESMATLWAGKETDLVTTQKVYAEDAVHNVLSLDEGETTPGAFAIWSRMSRSDIVDLAQMRAIRLPDHFSGAHRYLLVSSSEEGTSLDGTACVLWVEDGQVARHDCILPLSLESAEPPALVAPNAASIAERETVAAGHAEAIYSHDRQAMAQVTSPEIAHHILSTNQTYTLRGLDEYWSVMGLGVPGTIVDVDLPAPVDEVRWANFSGMGGGSLCVFWARDGLITRHDCIVPTTTTVSLGTSDAG